MCRRDRGHNGNGEIRISNNTIDNKATIVGAVSTVSPTTVSYTHLDVYKRQAKMTVIRPQDSVVGVMLYWDAVAQLVASEGIGIAQRCV